VFVSALPSRPRGRPGNGQRAAGTNDSCGPGNKTSPRPDADSMHEALGARGSANAARARWPGSAATCPAAGHRHRSGCRPEHAGRPRSPPHAPRPPGQPSGAVWGSPRRGGQLGELGGGQRMGGYHVGYVDGCTDQVLVDAHAFGQPLVSASQSDLAPLYPAAQTRRPRRTFICEATKPTTRTFLLSQRVSYQSSSKPL
jgi:hypothetical protein